MIQKKEKEQSEEQGNKEFRERMDRRRGFLWTMIWDNIQDIILGILLVLGFKKPSQTGPGGIPVERQVPNWFLSAFPGLTREDENEYNILLESHPDPAARIAAEEFHEMVEKDNHYDEVRYIVALVELRREFVDRVKHPAPKNECGCLGYEQLTLRDPVIAFLNRLLEAKNKGENPEETYKCQKEIALRRKLLPKKHFLKKAMEHKLETVAILAAIPCIIYWILYAFLG